MRAPARAEWDFSPERASSLDSDSLFGLGIINLPAVRFSGLTREGPLALTLTPSISSLSPSSYPADTVNHTMQIFGSNFQTGDTLTFTFPDGTTHPNSRTVTVVSSSEIDYQFNDAGDAGTWSVRVNSPDGTQYSSFRTFTVAAVTVTPSISSISPSTYPADSINHTMQIFGSNFQTGDSLTFTFPDGTTHPNSRVVTVVSIPEIDYQFNDAGDAGTWSVRVNSPDGTQHSSFRTFTVAAVTVTPSISSISPSTYPADSINHTMQIFGSNFQTGDSLTFTFPDGTTHPNSRVVTVVSIPEIDYQFNDAGDAGTWSVRVNSPDGTQHSSFRTFTVA